MSLKLAAALLTISLVFIARSAPAQSKPPAPTSLACTMSYVGFELNNPFTARHITMTNSTSPTDAPKMPEVSEMVARDSAGRVRTEQHYDTAPLNGSDPVILQTRDGGQIHTTRAELHVLTMIFDCPSGKMIWLQPGMRTARIYEGAPLQPGSRAERPYSFFFTSSLRHNPALDIFPEDLGHKTIDGIDALGVKTTQIGSQDDEWKGKPIRIFEKWVSDDLAATLIETTIDFKKKTETTSTLTDIRRVEPDASLFQIPTGFLLNPTPDEMPFLPGVPRVFVAHPKQ